MVPKNSDLPEQTISSFLSLKIGDVPQTDGNGLKWLTKAVTQWGFYLYMLNNHSTEKEQEMLVRLWLILFPMVAQEV